MKEFIINLLRICVVPSEQWKLVETGKDTRDLYLKFALPLVLLSALGRDIGLFFAAKPVLGYTHELVLLLIFNLIAWVIIPFILMFAASYVLLFILPRLGVQCDLRRNAHLVVYTFAPVYLATFIIYLHPLLRILIPIGIYPFVAYTLYIFWTGVKTLYHFTFGNTVKFVLISIALAFPFIFAAQHLYSLFIGLFFPGMEPYVK